MTNTDPINLVDFETTTASLDKLSSEVKSAVRTAFEKAGTFPKFYTYYGLVSDYRPYADNSNLPYIAYEEHPSISLLFYVYNQKGTVTVEPKGYTKRYITLEGPEITLADVLKEATTFFEAYNKRGFEAYNIMVSQKLGMLLEAPQKGPE